MCWLSLLVKSRVCYVIFGTLIFLDIYGALNSVVSLHVPEIGEATNTTNPTSETETETGGSEPSGEGENVGLVLMELFGLAVLLLTNVTALHGVRWGY